ncbi:G-type lectin S-receptor-like serine/threonine-protein kinase At2g19130 [Cryptomeria japonica]|uniref:G-type lectin S-receptor-like serine/threonine-protein kinase At2g19130 n=1 Tax=Cryptomeria japonica TaxID=3369 RepID=UPI0027DA38E9|nr:G-type lectin S-receptor-like serine/threonine-protein kinase At2g19130 [Cryptomeria japonica]
MPNGSLNSFLFSQSEDAEKVLDWKTRFEIALGTARGLVYLHEECRDRIIHCDIKPENILLDSDLSPKVADFGLAKLVGRDFSRVLTTTRGTLGYLAPEWISGLPITPKVDVYSFGMTLLEIISGRRNLDLKVEESRLYFPTWASSQIQRGNIKDIVDARIAGEANI